MEETEGRDRNWAHDGLCVYCDNYKQADAFTDYMVEIGYKNLNARDGVRHVKKGYYLVGRCSGSYDLLMTDGFAFKKLDPYEYRYLRTVMDLPENRMDFTEFKEMYMKPPKALTPDKEDVNTISDFLSEFVRDEEA